MQPSAASFTPLEDPMVFLPIGAPAEGDRNESKFERLLEAIEHHVRGEAGTLVEYESLARASQDPAIALVMGLILEDEERHHALLGRIASRLRDALYWTRSPEALPVATTPRTAVASDLPARVRGLIKEEQDGARALRDLAARERGIDGGLHSLLLEMMALDSDKHARLLRFVERRLEQRSR